MIEKWRTDNRIAIKEVEVLSVSQTRAEISEHSLASLLREPGQLFLYIISSAFLSILPGTAFMPNMARA